MVYARFFWSPQSLSLAVQDLETLRFGSASVFLVSAETRQPVNLNFDDSATADGAGGSPSEFICYPATRTDIVAGQPAQPAQPVLPRGEDAGSEEAAKRANGVFRFYSPRTCKYLGLNASKLRAVPGGLNCLFHVNFVDSPYVTIHPLAFPTLRVGFSADGQALPVDNVSHSSTTGHFIIIETKYFCIDSVTEPKFAGLRQLLDIQAAHLHDVADTHRQRLEEQSTDASTLLATYHESKTQVRETLIRALSARHSPEQCPRARDSFYSPTCLNQVAHLTQLSKDRDDAYVLAACNDSKRALSGDEIHQCVGEVYIQSRLHKGFLSLDLVGSGISFNGKPSTVSRFVIEPCEGEGDARLFKIRVGAIGASLLLSLCLLFFCSLTATCPRPTRD